MKLLHELDLAALAAQLGVDRVPLERHDWRWLAHLPDGRLLFVADDERGAARLQRERRLLTKLQPRLSFAVPAPLGDGELDLRRRIPGDTGLQLHWETLGDAARAETYADDLARLLAELHAALPVAEVEPADFDCYPLAAAELRPLVATLPVEIRGPVASAIEAYAAFAVDDPVLSHGDVGTHNLIFDGGRVIGIVDFEEAAIRDRHHDFKYLPSYGPRVLSRVLDGYRQRSGVSLSPARIRILHLCTALSFWAWRERDPDAHDRLSSRNRDQALAWIGFAL